MMKYGTKTIENLAVDGYGVLIRAHQYEGSFSDPRDSFTVSWYMRTGAREFGNAIEYGPRTRPAPGERQRTWFKDSLEAQTAARGDAISTIKRLIANGDIPTL